MALVTAAEYKTSRGISGTDYDTRIGEAIKHAESWVREYCGRDSTNGFESASRTEVYSGDDTDTIRLREWPEITITSVKLLTGASSGAATFGETVSASGYYASESGNLYRTSGVAWTWTHAGCAATWPEGNHNIQVVYTAGYATIPDNLKEACFVLMDSWFQNTQRDTLTLNQSAMGIQNRQHAPSAETAARLSLLLAPWRKPYA